MEDKLISLLESLNFPVRRQGSITGDEKYPKNFFTFWNNNSFDDSYYDNKPNKIIWDFDVNFYSEDVDVTYSVLKEAITLLQENSFMISGKGHDVYSDEPTHTGRGINVFYVEKN